MKELKLRYSAIVCRVIFFVFILIVQVSAIILSSVREYLILVNVTKGMNCVLVILFVYFVLKSIKFGDYFVPICIECMGTFLSIILYRDFLDRVSGDIVPNKFIMMPYLSGIFVSVGFMYFVGKGYLNKHMVKKIYGMFRFIDFIFSCSLVILSFYFLFCLKNVLLGFLALFIGCLMFFVYRSLKR